ncbi:MAG: hypothetical protein LBK44_03830 [Spirochaetales bacterium]|nr:hypothetical protein [Spirochaetales bacterium]
MQILWAFRSNPLRGGGHNIVYTAHTLCCHQPLARAQRRAQAVCMQSIHTACG